MNATKLYFHIAVLLIVGLLGLHRAERIYGYARLTGDRGTVVEIIFASDWLGHGYGVARTSAEEEYRVTF